MPTIKLTLDAKKHGAFDLYEDVEKIGEMVVSVNDKTITVYHTEVDESAAGKGYAKLLLDAMITYATSNSLKVIPLCPYVHAQFNKHSELYNKIWQKPE